VSVQVDRKTTVEDVKQTNPLAGKKVLALFNADVKKRIRDMQEKEEGYYPRPDFLSLIELLNADYLDWNDIDKNFIARLIKRYVSKEFALAWVAFLKARKYDVLYCDGEPIGIPLATFLKYSFSRKKVNMIGHILSPDKKAIFFRRLFIASHIGVIFLHSSYQYLYAINRLRIPAEKLELLPYQVDQDFWRPDAVVPEPGEKPYIVSAGLEFRDYGTLIKAVEGLPVDLRIAAASHWSRRSDAALTGKLPENVNVSSYNYHELRKLYAGCKFVVVSLQDVDFQAGITTILEAMAMGKAVIVTRTQGQLDVVNDRRATIRGSKQRSGEAKFLKYFNSQHSDKQTGIYVNPEEPEELRKAIKFLLDNPERAEEIGRNARLVLEEMMTLELFCQRIQEGIAKAEGRGRGIG
jgi:glycosyltransferase involved in cell wall biosynthesis